MPDRVKYDRREYEGEVNGEGIVHAVGLRYGHALYAACGREVSDLWFTVKADSVVTCLTCIVYDKGDY